MIVECEMDFIEFYIHSVKEFVPFIKLMLSYFEITSNKNQQNNFLQENSEERKPDIKDDIHSDEIEYSISLSIPGISIKWDEFNASSPSHSISIHTVFHLVQFQLLYYENSIQHQKITFHSFKILDNRINKGDYSLFHEIITPRITFQDEFNDEIEINDDFNTLNDDKHQIVIHYYFHSVNKRKLIECSIYHSYFVFVPDLWLTILSKFLLPLSFHWKTITSSLSFKNIIVCFLPFLPSLSFPFLPFPFLLFLSFFSSLPFFKYLFYSPLLSPSIIPFPPSSSFSLFFFFFFISSFPPLSFFLSSLFLYIPFPSPSCSFLYYPLPPPPVPISNNLLTLKGYLFLFY